MPPRYPTRIESARKRHEMVCFHCWATGTASVMHFGSSKPVGFCNVCTELLTWDPSFRAEVMRACEDTWL